MRIGYEMVNSQPGAKCRVGYNYGGSVAEWSARRTRNPAVPGSSPVVATCWICPWSSRVQILGRLLLNFFKLQTSGYYNWILVNFFSNVTKRLDTDVTSGKPREITYDICAPFANLVESWKIWQGRRLRLNYSRQVLFSLSLTVTVEFESA